jgi:hypothetical protein
VHDDACGERKGEEVSHGVGGGEVEWGVFFVGGYVEPVVFLKKARDVVDLAEAIVGFVVGNGEVGELPDLMKIVKRRISSRDDDMTATK